MPYPMPRFKLPREPISNSFKRFYQLLQPYMSPQLTSYLLSPSPENYAACKALLESPGFKAASAEASRILEGDEYTGPEIHLDFEETDAASDMEEELALLRDYNYSPADRWWEQCGMDPDLYIHYPQLETKKEIRTMETNPSQNSVTPLSPESIPEPKNLPQSKQPRRKRGAPEGNNNALKHGFYARQLPVSQLSGLEQVKSTNLEDEIEVMRIFMRRVVELGSDTTDLEKSINLLRILTFASMGINRLVRTQITLASPANENLSILRQALSELENEWPDLHTCKENLRHGSSSPSAAVQPGTEEPFTE
jgi:hypothetical protein